MKINFCTTKKFICTSALSVLMITSCIYPQQTNASENITIYKNLSAITINDEYIDKVNNLYNEKADKGKIKEAINLAEYIIKLNSKLYGENSVNTALSYISPVYLYIDEGQYQKAKEHIDKALNIALKIPENKDLLNQVYADLFMYYSSTQDIRNAIKLLNDIDAAARYDSDKLDVIVKTGDLIGLTEGFNKSIKTLKKYDKESDKILGNISDNKLRYYEDLVYITTWAKNEEYKKIEEYSKLAEEVFEKLNINDDDAAYRNKSLILGYYAEILDEENFNRIMESNKKYIKTPESFVGYYSGLLHFYKDLKNKPKANEYIDKISLYLNKIPEKSMTMVNYYNTMANYYEEFQDKANELKMYEKALKILEEQKESIPAIYAYYLKEMAKYQSGIGEYDKSEKYFNQAIAILNKIYKETDYPFYDINKDYGEMLVKKGNYQEAEVLYKKALEISDKLKGKYSCDSADIYSDFAGLYSAQGKNIKAVYYIDKTINIYEKIYGKNHIKTYEKIINKYNIYNNISKLKASNILLSVLNADEKDIIKGAHKKDIYYKLYINTANYYLEKGDIKLAKIYIEKAEQEIYLQHQFDEINDIKSQIK